MKPFKIAILSSTNGTNLQSFIDARDRGELENIEIPLEWLLHHLAVLEPGGADLMLRRTILARNAHLRRLP